MTGSSLVEHWPSKRQLAFSVARVLLAIVVVLTIYDLLPATPNSELGNWLIIAVSLAVFLAVLYWQIREVGQSTRPVIRAVEALGITLTLFLVMFATQYIAESLASPSAFSEPLDKFTSLYYTVTVFSTVGFGDITPVSQVSRSLTMAQMIGNLVFLGVGVRVLTSVARNRLEQRRSDVVREASA